MEGRDIGTVVFPRADVKIYLDASPEERARRRASDPAHTGGPAAVAEVKTALTERDELDRTRAGLAAPRRRGRRGDRYDGEVGRGGGGEVMRVIREGAGGWRLGTEELGQNSR